MIEVPDDDPPVTTPEDGSTPATAEGVLLQVPPVAASLNVVLPPSHKVSVPVIAGSVASTVTVVVVWQPASK